MNQLAFRRAIDTTEDCKALYYIKCDDNNVKWSGFDSAPSYKNFKNWYNRQINENLREIWLAFLGDECVGFFYIIPIDDDECCGGIGVLSQYAGRGFGKSIVDKQNYICKENDSSVSEVWTAEDSICSKKCCQEAGYIPSDNNNDMEIRHLLGGVR